MSHANAPWPSLASLKRAGGAVFCSGPRFLRLRTQRFTCDQLPTVDSVPSTRGLLTAALALLARLGAHGKEMGVGQQVLKALGRGRQLAGSGSSGASSTLLARCSGRRWGCRAWDTLTHTTWSGLTCAGRDRAGSDTRSGPVRHPTRGRLAATLLAKHLPPN